MKALKFILIVLIYSIKSFSQNWQCGSTPIVILDVRDKANYSQNIQSFKFEVTNITTHKSFFCTVNNAGVNGALVYFPSNFTDNNNKAYFFDAQGKQIYSADQGNYEWKCSTNNTVFVTGDFVLGNSNQNMQFHFEKFKRPANSKGSYAVTGTVIAQEAEGNNYWRIDVKGGNGKTISVWGPVSLWNQVQYYKNGAVAKGSQIKIGTKIGVIGTKSDGDGGPQVEPKVIDILN